MGHRSHNNGRQRQQHRDASTRWSRGRSRLASNGVGCSRDSRLRGGTGRALGAGTVGRARRRRGGRGETQVQGRTALRPRGGKSRSGASPTRPRGLTARGCVPAAPPAPLRVPTAGAPTKARPRTRSPCSSAGPAEPAAPGTPPGRPPPSAPAAGPGPQEPLRTPRWSRSRNRRS